MIRLEACLLSAVVALCIGACRPSVAPAPIAPRVTVALAATPPASEPTLREVRQAESEARSASELLLTAKLLTNDEEPPSREAFAPTSYVGGIACNVVMSIDPGYAVPFRLRIQDPPFVYVRSTLFRVVVPETRAAPKVLMLTMDASGFVLHGAVNPRDLAIHPALPLELDGILVLGPRASVELVAAAKPDRLNVGYDLVPDDRLVMKPRILTKAVACSDVTLDPSAFSEHEGLERSALGSVVLPPGTGLARGPGGAPFARVPAGEGIEAFVVEVLPAHLRVAVRRYGDTVVGFVPKASTRLADIGEGSIGVFGHGSGFGTGDPLGFGHATCPHDVPLSGEFRGQVAVVGAVKKDATMRIEGERETEFVIGFRSRHYALVQGASFLVKKSDLDGCRMRVAPNVPGRPHQPGVWPHNPPTSFGVPVE